MDNWGLTAFGEELLFAGVICTLTVRLFGREGRRRRRWAAVPLVAVLFALWHLPGYLAIGHAGGALVGRLGLNLASWLVFGTDYGVTPLITNEPVFGLVFMAMLIAGAWLTGRRQTKDADAAKG